MSNISDYAITQYLTTFGPLVAPTLPPGFYLCLCTSLPVHGNTGATIAELTSAGGYARAPMVFGSPSGGSMNNATSIVFIPSSAAYSASAGYWAVTDSPTIGAGNLWYFGTFTALIAVTLANYQVVIPPNSISLGAS